MFLKDTYEFDGQVSTNIWPCSLVLLNIRFPLPVFNIFSRFLYYSVKYSAYGAFTQHTVVPQLTACQNLNLKRSHTPDLWEKSSSSCSLPTEAITVSMS